jgi:hypothetical protein
LAVAEAEFGHLAVSRAETRTGADYYLGPSTDLGDVDDLERAYRLEVSGVDKGSRSVVRQRLMQKIDQARQGESMLPAFAWVVGFKACLVAVAKVEDLS